MSRCGSSVAESDGWKDTKEERRVVGEVRALRENANPLVHFLPGLGKSPQIKLGLMSCC